MKKRKSILISCNKLVYHLERSPAVQKILLQNPEVGTKWNEWNIWE